MAAYVGAIDQGTTSTRFMVFDRAGRIVSWAQREHRQIYPQPGWVEHDPEEIWRNTQQVIAEAMRAGGLRAGDLAAVGITNQRETTIVWNRRTGAAVYNAIVWQDTRVADAVAELARDGGADRFRGKTGLPLATYFSALKIRWILDHVSGVRARAEAGDVLFGTVDTFLLWQLTGGAAGGVHLTDVTNASRTQLMNLEVWRGTRRFWGFAGFLGGFCRALPRAAKILGWRRSRLLRMCRSLEFWAINRRRWWGRLVLRRERRRTLTEREVFC